MGGPTPVAPRGEPCEFVHRSWPAHPRQLAPLRAEVRCWLTPFTLPDDAEDSAYPQRGFSRAIRTTNAARTSLIGGRPVRCG